ncbi:hypothetical protein ACFWM7_23090 [Streptomyces sp. NPDC058375]|uniref:hypothetical protein n=1 Tax=Streptomyces sp. NPDC058375 TaxID=3346467 RepID=UPI0036478251
MLNRSEDWRFAVAALVLVAGGVWGVSRALSVRNAQIARLIDVLDAAVGGEAVSQGRLQEVGRR